MKRNEVDRSYHQGSRMQPMVNVKCRQSCIGLSREVVRQLVTHGGASTADAEQAMQWAHDSAAEMFWEDAKELARDIFGAHATVYSEGRSGGWLVVHGLTDVETWSAPALNKWAKFARIIRRTIANRHDDIDGFLGVIDANDWANIHANAEETARLADLAFQVA